MSSIHLYPVPAGRFWAKLHPRVNPTEWHPLIAHSADVAAVLQHLLRRSKLSDRLATLIGQAALTPDQIAALTYLAALHDVGKVNHGFQTQALSGAARGPWKERGHVTLFLQSLDCEPVDSFVSTVTQRLHLDFEDAYEVIATVVSHHGRPHTYMDTLDGMDAYWLPNTHRDPVREMARLEATAFQWAAEGAGDMMLPRFSCEFSHLFAGILTLADWIGSTRTAFDFARWADDVPERYWRQAQKLAERACTQIGLTPRTTIVSLHGATHPGVSLLRHIFSKIFGDERPPELPPAEPTPLQRRIATMELPVPGSRLLIESETGSGKTEAALALYARLRAAGQVGGLLFALPTRATAYAMHKRVMSAIETMYQPGERPTIVLAMGGEQAFVQVTYGSQHSREMLTGEPITYPDPATTRHIGDEELVRWSSSNSKKFFAAEIVVGTLDQVLLGGLAVKHAHLRLAAFSRHLLVVDELHSYDRYMAEVLQEVLDIHTAAGGVALLMSATLSDRERLRFGGLLSSEDDQTPFAKAVTRDYPVISVCVRSGESWLDSDLEPAPGPPKPPLRWQLCDEDAGLRRAVRAARGGARVCILRNTVKGARATVQALLADAEARHLLWHLEGSAHTPAYHSRYTLPDRKALDVGVLAAYGRGGTGGNGRILVATQVAEQSLDVDFDLLVTDLGPVDVLLQRMGRVWRHRERDDLRPPACGEVQVWVIEPEDGFEPLLGRDHGGPNGWGTVYEHLGFLELTRRVINHPEHQGVAVPGDNRRLIESVYHVEPQWALRGESAAWEAHFAKNEGKALSHEITAKDATIRFDETYVANTGRFQRDAATTIRTRLGDDRVRVLLPQELPGFYDPTGKVNSVDLPYEELLRNGVSLGDLKEPCATGGVSDGHCVRYELQDFRFAYGPQGWVWGQDMANREERFEVTDRIREGLPELPEHEVEQDVANALRAVRSDAAAGP